MALYLAKWFAVALATFALLYGAYTTAVAMQGTPPVDEAYYSAARIGDIVLLYALMPAYFLFVAALLVDRNRHVRHQLQALAPSEWTLPQAPLWRWLVVFGLIGWLYGALDYLVSINESEDWYRRVSYVLAFGNGFVWMCAGFLFGWRLWSGRFYRALGAVVRVDLFNLHSVRPFGLVATFDVLAVMGALALAPLQSLSTEFEWSYYRTAFAVGIPGAIIFLILPMLGARANIAAAKAMTLADADRRVAQADRDDAMAFELLLAYRDRIREVSTWPIDTRLVSRALLYLVVPPLAWVGAAIVERSVDQVF